ncbi:hypothetical protein KDK77_07020 [bacterium]|nr:hypothetical protein [bacterium]
MSISVSPEGCLCAQLHDPEQPELDEQDPSPVPLFLKNNHILRSTTAKAAATIRKISIFSIPPTLYE